MKFAEGIFIWFAVAAYTLSVMSYITAIVFKPERWLRAGTITASIGLIAQIISVALRWISTGHPPVYGVYEHTLTNSLAVMLAFLLTIRKYPKVKVFGAGAVGFSLIMLGHGMLAGTEQEALSVPYKSNWLWVHVGFGQLAYGAFIVSALVAIGYLLKDRAIASGRENSYSKLPELETMDELILKFIALGFIGETGMIASGSIWAASLWGSYWSWEPLQTWSLISWLIYGAFLHLRPTMGWKGRRAAWLSLIALAGIMFVFWGISLVSNQHTRVL